MKEIWKDIEGYENYKVSNKGRVKSKRRVIYREIDGEIQPSYIKKENIITPTDNGNGYLIVGLRITQGGERKNKYVHRLVAETFIKNPNNYDQVNHKDYDRRNNNVNNLEWVTVSENIRHSLINQPRRKKRSVPTKTGHRYIGYRNGYYRVCITNPRVDKTFKTLEEAIAFRNRLFEEEK